MILRLRREIAVEYAEKLVDGTNKELHFSMTSNMTLMNEEIADYIASKPTFSVLCSIDGPQEIHDEHRKTIEGKGSFEKAIAGVRKLVEARKRHKNQQPIIFSAVITPPYTREKFEKINTFMAKLEWLPKNSMVEVSYVSYESKKSHYIPDDEAHRLILYRSYDIKLQRTGDFGAKCTKFIPFV